MPDLSSLTIVEAGDLLAKRDLSAVELVEATLERLEVTEPQLHAYVRIDGEAALASAQRLDEQGPGGPLHGIPVGVKDVIATEDLATEAGSRLLAGHRPGADATVVARVRAAGAVVIGKHVTHEFAGGQDDPPTRNPWGLDRYPGGSSAGGGVSVQAGSSLLALGTDAGGSVRKPACVTSTVGLKATHGRISGSGTLRHASAPSLDHVGTFTRTVEDCAIALSVLAGYEPADPRSIDEPVLDYRASLGAGIKGFRVGVATGAFPEAVSQPAVWELFREALDTLEQLGGTLVDVELPSFEHALAALFTILPAEVAVPHRQWLLARPDLYHPRTRRMMELGLILPASHVQQAHNVRRAMVVDAERAFRDARLDVLVTPTLPVAPPRFDDMIPGDFGSLIPFTGPFNLTGQPALSVPAGFTDLGLPAGLQIVGRPFAEATVLRVGHAYQQATAWHLQRPALVTATAG